MEAWLMRPRIEQELVLLRQFLPSLQHVEQSTEDWFLLPNFRVPDGWRIGTEEIGETHVCFSINAGYPTATPYGFLMPAGINFRGMAPGNTGSSATPPFPTHWQHFSWQPEQWFPNADVNRGSNLLIWVRSFTDRLKEGA
jgi:hypothetical protein